MLLSYYLICRFINKIIFLLYSAIFAPLTSFFYFYFSVVGHLQTIVDWISFILHSWLTHACLSPRYLHSSCSQTHLSLYTSIIPQTRLFPLVLNMFTTRHPSSSLPIFDTRYHQLSDDAVYKHKPPRSWSERIQKIQTLLRQQDLLSCSQNEVLLDVLIATWDDHRSSIKPLSNPRKETSICLKRCMWWQQRISRFR